MSRHLHILLNLLALFVISYIVVDTFYKVTSAELHKLGGPKVVALKEAEMQGKKSLVVQEYSKIVERNIFGATEIIEQAPVEDVKPIEILEETSLQLSLLGTIAGDSTGDRAVILDKRERSQGIYRVGDLVQDAEIMQILRGKVVLRHGGKDEILTMVEADEKPHSTAKTAQRRRTVIPPRVTERVAASSGAAGGNAEEEIISIGQDVLQESMGDIGELMTQVRVRPYFRRGKAEGLIVSQIQPGSIFTKLGMANGDIISSVNGNNIQSPDEAFQFYNSLKSGENVSIEITRRGQKKMLTYDIK